VPELPEVETTRIGLAPHLIGARIEKIILRRANLRWPIPDAIQRLVGQRIDAITRRAKYLLMHTQAGSALWHLGMSGSLRVLAPEIAPRTHDHVDWQLDSGKNLRFYDPRRFGCLMFQAPATLHPLLVDLGPEPLALQDLVANDASVGYVQEHPAHFTAEYLYTRSRGRMQVVKAFLMDQATVVGVGNIYVAESLFQAHVRPQRKAGSLTRVECARLVAAIQAILCHAITRGGTTLRDFINPDGAPGYFEQELFVYGRQGQACKVCATLIKAADLGTRQSLYCPKCQR
jgi:formamidopyrimidine-DNA glycosylase